MENGGIEMISCSSLPNGFVIDKFLGLAREYSVYPTQLPLLYPSPIE